MKNRILKLVILLVFVLLIFESFSLINYANTNKKMDVLYNTSNRINASLNTLNNQTLETDFTNNQVKEQLNSLKEEADQNAKDLDEFHALLASNKKKELIKKQQDQNLILIRTIESENSVIQEVDDLLAENPYTENELSKDVSLKGDVNEDTQVRINDNINNLAQSDKKEALVATMAAINTAIKKEEERKEKEKEKEKNKKMVALTFDDGPNDSSTIDILDTLKANNVKATFFVIGLMVEQYPDTLKRIHEEGHEIGNHSYDHKDLTAVSQDGLKKEILGTNEIIKGVIGGEPTIIRPPYGSYNDAVKNMSNMKIMLWNVDSLDWKNKNTEQTISNIENNVFDGSVVLMHDIHPTTAAGLDKLIKDLKDQGYSFGTASELYSDLE